MKDIERGYLQLLIKVEKNNGNKFCPTTLDLNCMYCMYFMSNKTNVRHRCVYVNWKVK